MNKNEGKKIGRRQRRERAERGEKNTRTKSD
jgi:hypothetical protein